MNCDSPASQSKTPLSSSYIRRQIFTHQCKIIGTSFWHLISWGSQSGTTSDKNSTSNNNSNNNNKHVMPLARISLTLSRHFSLSFIAFGWSSGLHPVSSHSCCMYVRAGRPAFAWPYAGVHRSTSLMSSSLLLQQCPACLVSLTCMVFVMGGKWPYSWCLVGCCHQDLFNIALMTRINSYGTLTYKRIN